ncbi:MAG: hypothetical protein WCW26_02715 [Candidatus Buchananbacteria bacterium]
MIYLIGGAPRCGKTTIAKQLSRKLKTSWISADTIESVVAAYVSKQDLPKLFPKGVIRKETKLSNDLMYEKYSTKNITDVYIKQSETSWQAIKIMAKCAIQEEHGLIIEGHQIHPKLISQLKKEFTEVKGIIVVRTDLKAIVLGALKNKFKKDWFIKNTKNPETYQKMGLMIKNYSQYFVKESKKYNIKIINTQTGFRKQVKLAVQYLVKYE